MLTNDDLDDIQSRIDDYLRPGSRLLTNGINNDEAIELVKMARRYAWLRRGKSYRLACKKSDIYVAYHADKDYGDALDAAIDQAIEGERDDSEGR